MSLINQLVVICCLGFITKVGVFENSEVCWEPALWWVDRSQCLASAVALSSDGREALWHAPEERSGMRRERWVWFFCVKSRAVFILAVALENWNIYDSVLKQEGRRLFPFLDVASCASNSDDFLLLCSPLSCYIPSVAVSVSWGLFAVQSPSLESAGRCPWSGKGMSLWCTSREP